MKKSLKQMGSIQILNNNQNYEISDYMDYLSDMDKDMEYSETEYNEWCQTMNEFNVEDDLYTIEHAEAWNTPVVVEGYFGIWGGLNYVKGEFGSVYSAILACIEDMQLFKACWKDGKIYVDTAHHDGNCRYIIRLKDGRRKLPYLA